MEWAQVFIDGGLIMEKFTSIESFKSVITRVRKNCDYHDKPYPTLTFVGTCKLHGTNCGVRRSVGGKYYPQGRTRLLSIESDNYGFAFFYESHSAAFHKLFESFPTDKDVTIYGEWAGQGIQKHVAIASVPKHFIIFGVKVGNGEDAQYIDLPHDLYDNENGIYNIYQIPTYEVEIDFLNPVQASEVMYELTMGVETLCPWTHNMFNIDNVGEGIVWHSKDEPNNPALWFKTKGLKHQGRSDSKQKQIKISDEQLESKQTLVDEILPQWRLEQGLSELTERGLDHIVQNTGAYLKWVCSDCIKEEIDTIAASGFTWKDVQSIVSKQARNFYLTECNKL